mgnify:CR=1 FL=1
MPAIPIPPDLARLLGSYRRAWVDYYGHREVIGVVDMGTSLALSHAQESLALCVLGTYDLAAWQDEARMRIEVYGNAQADDALEDEWGTGRHKRETAGTLEAARLALLRHLGIDDAEPPGPTGEER